VAGLLAGSMTAKAAPVNLLVNPGFETGDYSGWIVGGNTTGNAVVTDGTLITEASSFFGPTYSNVRSGDYSSYHLARAEPTIESLTLTQTIMVQQNDTIDIGFWLGNDSDRTFGISFSDIWLQIFIDDVGLLSGHTEAPVGSNPSDFIQIMGSFNTGNRTSITAIYQIQGSGQARAGISVDDFFFIGEQVSPVPIPAAVWLFGSALLGFFGLAKVRSSAV